MFYHLIISINDDCKGLTDIIEKPVDSAYYINYIRNNVLRMLDTKACVISAKFS